MGVKNLELSPTTHPPLPHFQPAFPLAAWKLRPLSLPRTGVSLPKHRHLAQALCP